jgi:hypothetical protein
VRNRLAIEWQGRELSEPGIHMVDERIKGIVYKVESICRRRKKVVNGKCYQKGKMQD